MLVLTAGCDQKSCQKGLCFWYEHFCCSPREKLGRLCAAIFIWPPLRTLKHNHVHVYEERSCSQAVLQLYLIHFWLAWRAMNCNVDWLHAFFFLSGAKQAAAAVAQQRSYVIGLTGGIGAGKSNIAKRLEELGARVIYADQVGFLLHMHSGISDHLTCQYTIPFFVETLEFPGLPSWYWFWMLAVPAHIHSWWWPMTETRTVK